MSQAFFTFEQSVLDKEQSDRDAIAAAKAAALAAREAAKRQEEIDKASRRRDRAEKSRIRNTVQWAACGIRLYNRNAYSACGWTHCRHCGAPLRFFDLIGDAQEDAKNRECKRA